MRYICSVLCAAGTRSWSSLGGQLWWRLREYFEAVVCGVEAMAALVATSTQLTSAAKPSRARLGGAACAVLVAMKNNTAFSFQKWGVAFRAAGLALERGVYFVLAVGSQCAVSATADGVLMAQAGHNMLAFELTCMATATTTCGDICRVFHSYCRRIHNYLQEVYSAGFELCRAVLSMRLVNYLGSAATHRGYAAASAR